MVADIEAQRRVIAYLRRVIAEYLAHDLRPLIVGDGHACRVGPLPYPPSLIDLLTQEATILFRLECELHFDSRPRS